MCNIIDCIEDVAFTLGSDGSVHGENASYGTRIQNTQLPTVQLFLQALLQADSSFISKAYGYLSVLYLLKAIIVYFELNITATPMIKVYINNQGLLKRLAYGKETSIAHCQLTGSDVTREITSVEDTMPLHFDYTHVKLYKCDNIKDDNIIPFPN